MNDKNIRANFQNHCLPHPNYNCMTMAAPKYSADKRI